MAVPYPARGTGLWDLLLKAYIDAGGLTEAQVAQVASDADQAAAALVTIEALLDQAASTPNLIPDPDNPGFYIAGTGDTDGGTP